jgi:hypothetical protein
VAKVEKANGVDVTHYFNTGTLDNLGSGRLKFSELANNHVKISVSGDTGIIRGVTVRRRSAFPGSTGGADQERRLLCSSNLI